MIHMLCCPVCGRPLDFSGRQAACEGGHSFDVAKEGYVNLLCGSKSGEKMGDDKLSARSRRDFLDKGYYAPLKQGLQALLAGTRGRVLDICCGEGYYTAGLAEDPALEVYGFDISKEMVRLAAKRGGARFFVANMARIPVADGAVDCAVHLFAPFLEGEFARVLKPGGRLYTVVPGKRHLYGLKQALYDTPYFNDEALPETAALRLVDTRRICGEITLACPEDIEAVFRMTPYYFHTSQKDRDKLAGLQTLATPIEFFIGIYEKPL